MSQVERGRSSDCTITAYERWPFRVHAPPADLSANRCHRARIDSISAASASDAATSSGSLRRSFALARMAYRGPPLRTLGGMWRTASVYPAGPPMIFERLGGFGGAGRAGRVAIRARTGRADTRTCASRGGAGSKSSILRNASRCRTHIRIVCCDQVAQRLSDSHDRHSVRRTDTALATQRTGGSADVDWRCGPAHRP